MTHQDIDSCKRDIEIIKSTIEKSKVNLGSIATLFITYGIAVLIIELLGMFFSQASGRSWYPTVRWLLLGLTAAISLVLLFVYVKKYASAKKASNRYTLRLLQVWGFAMLYMPLLASFSEISARLLYGDGILVGFRYALLMLPEMFEIIAFVCALLYTGITLDKKTVTVCALLLIPLFIISYHVGAGAARTVADASISIYGYVSTRTLICKIIVLLIYIIMGISLLPPKKQIAALRNR